jgi:hypothetical protein
MAAIESIAKMCQNMLEKVVYIEGLIDLFNESNRLYLPFTFLFFIL